MEVTSLARKRPSIVALRGPALYDVAETAVDLLATAARFLPRRFTYALGDAGGLATLLAWPRGRQNAIRNFAQVLGQPSRSREVHRTTRRSFTHFGRMAVDLLRHRTLTVEQLRAEIKAEGLEHIDAALTRGKGAILVAPHLGNWEAGVSLGCFVSHRALAVADDGFLASLVASHRARAGIDIIPRSKSLRPILRALSRNELVILVSDLAKDLRAVDVQFFGQTSRVPVGPAQLARKTGAPLVPIYAIRDRDQTTIVRLEPPLTPTVSDNADRDIAQMSQWMADFFARIIRRYVDQWYPFQQYWADRATS